MHEFAGIDEPIENIHNGNAVLMSQFPERAHRAAVAAVTVHNDPHDAELRLITWTIYP